MLNFKGSIKIIQIKIIPVLICSLFLNALQVTDLWSVGVTPPPTPACSGTTPYLDTSANICVATCSTDAPYLDTTTNSCVGCISSNNPGDSGCQSDSACCDAGVCSSDNQCVSNALPLGVIIGIAAVSAILFGLAARVLYFVYKNSSGDTVASMSEMTPEEAVDITAVNIVQKYGPPSTVITASGKVIQTAGTTVAQAQEMVPILQKAGQAAINSGSGKLGDMVYYDAATDTTTTTPSSVVSAAVQKAGSPVIPTQGLSPAIMAAINNEVAVDSPLLKNVMSELQQYDQSNSLLDTLQNTDDSELALKLFSIVTLEAIRSDDPVEIQKRIMLKINQTATVENGKNVENDYKFVFTGTALVKANLAQKGDLLKALASNPVFTGRSADITEQAKLAAIYDTYSSVRGGQDDVVQLINALGGINEGASDQQKANGILRVQMLFENTVQLNLDENGLPRDQISFGW